MISRTSGTEAMTMTALDHREVTETPELTPETRQRPWPRYMRAELGLRNYWYPALLARQVKAKPVDVKMLGEELVIIRDRGKVYCLQARCAHRGVPLSAGRSEFP